MNVSGPCFVIIKNGAPFNKYEVVTTTKTPLSITTEVFYFKKKDDAELYARYLKQEAGLDNINKLLTSDRTFKWEKEEYKEFRDSINWDELRKAVKGIKFEYHKEVFRRNKK
jgi:hypothetical protein